VPSTASHLLNSLGPADEVLEHIRFIFSYYIQKNLLCTLEEGPRQGNLANKLLSNSTLLEAHVLRSSKVNSVYRSRLSASVYWHCSIQPRGTRSVFSSWGSGPPPANQRPVLRLLKGEQRGKTRRASGAGVSPQADGTVPALLHAQVPSSLFWEFAVRLPLNPSSKSSPAGRV